MTEKVTLRPIAAEELGPLLKLLGEPIAGDYQWFGFQGQRINQLRRRFETEGLVGAEESFLAVCLNELICAGWLNWRPVGRFGNYEVGIALFAGTEDAGSAPRLSSCW